MTTNGLSPFDAAARLLVFGAPVVVGSGLTGILLGRLKLRPVVVIAAGSTLQLIGTTLLARSSLEYRIHTSQYAFQVLVGLGLGLVMPALIYLLPYTMDRKDLGENSL
jgi:predicted MFS family arabinose efflux permease